MDQEGGQADPDGCRRATAQGQPDSDADGGSAGEADGIEDPHSYLTGFR